MKKDIKLLQHEEKYREEIDKMLDVLLAEVVEFYKDYDGLTISGASYDGTVSFGSGDSKIKFDYTNTGGFYPEFAMTVSRLGSAFRTPKERLFGGSFFMKGVSREYIDYMYKEFELSSLIMVRTEDGMGREPSRDPKVKILDLFKQAEPQLQKWKDCGTASDIFLF